MCLSTVYRDSVKQDNMVMKNVRMIEYQNGNIVLTDLMERQMSIEGDLVMANLVDGVAVIRENNHTGNADQKMKTYEVVREIPNSCKNNQMRDVFIKEVSCGDPEQYVRGLFSGQQCEFDVQRGENGDATVFVRTGDIYQKFLFTLIED